jgi:sec-independent protein translocase protein TatA
MFMGFLREPSHLIFIGLIVVVLFGSRRLPDAARGLGRSMRIFKSEIKQMQDDDVDKGKRSAEVVEPLEGKVVGPQTPHAERADESVRETPRNL